MDDVITKGRTLMAAASLVREALPSATIRVFAFVRTLGLVPDVLRIVEPCWNGSLTLVGDDVEREP